MTSDMNRMDYVPWGKYPSGSGTQTDEMTEVYTQGGAMHGGSHA